MSELPAQFIENMRRMMPEEEFPAFLRSFDAPCARAVRSRLGSDTFPPDAEDAVPWCEAGHYLPPSSDAGACVLHEAGAWYLQEASAMVPAQVLAPRPGEKVLDLCAAPGGKSTQLAMLMQNEGLLVANEIVPSRAKILSSNIERMGCTNTIVTNAAPQQLSRVWPSLFDRILVDAPCSGEGMFRRHPEARAEWNADSPSLCAERQLSILDHAARMLRPGGRLVYSTCTFNDLENEGTVQAFLTAHPEFSLVPFSLPGLPACQGYLHIWPHQVRGEGHFCALFEKSADTEGVPVREAALPRPAKAEQPICDAFLRENIAVPVRADALFMGRAVRLPSFVPVLDGVRVLRLGLHLGEIKGKLFFPDHALAMALPCVRRFDVTEEQAVCYLRGEVINADVPFSGFCAPVYKGFQLGFGKASDGQIKNHYPKGLRRDLTQMKARNG